MADHESDPDFHSMRFEAPFWYARHDVPALGGEIEVLIAEEEGPGDPERIAMQRIVPRLGEWMPQIEQTILNYYLKLRTFLERELGEGEMNYMPLFADPADLRPMRSNPSLDLRSDWTDRPRVLVCWECDWDPEHGLAVAVREDGVECADSQAALSGL